MNKYEMIKDMAKVITDLEDCEHNVCFIDCRLDCYCADCEYDSKEKKGICGCIEYVIAETLYNAGYRKVADDEIVIKQTDYVELNKDFYDWKKEYDHNCLLRLEVFELEKQLEQYKNKAKYYYNECKMYGSACYIDSDLED